MSGLGIESDVDPGLVCQNYISLKKQTNKLIIYSQVNNNFIIHPFPLKLNDSNYYSGDKFPLHFYKEQPHNILSRITLCIS